MSCEDVEPMPDGAIDTRQVALPERLALQYLGAAVGSDLNRAGAHAIRAALDAAKAEALRGSAPHVAAAIEAL